MLNDLKAVGVPDEQARIQALQQMQTQLQGDTEFDKISEDPQLRQAQIAALAGLQGVVDSGGQTLQDQATLAKIQQDEGARERGAREALMQRAAQQGTSGSGFELAAQLANQQGAASRGAEQSLNVAAQAQQRALDALMQKGTLGGQVRGQDFSQEAQRAQAQDLINRFNTGQQTDMQKYKFGTETDLRQQQFANTLAKQQAVANATNKVGSRLDAQAKTANLPAEKVGQAIGLAGISIYDYLTKKKFF
jgi:hypothetical protein